MLHLQHVVKTTYFKWTIDKEDLYILCKDSKLKSHFTGSIFYEIELTAKYCKMLGSQVFEQFNAGINREEFAILDTLSANPGICQRDLAKLVVRDRANTGKILDSLEKQGLVKRKLSIKNNRPVKVTELTEKGIQKTKEVTAIVKPHMDLVKEKLQNSDLARLSIMLQEFREVLNSTLEMKI